MTDKIVVLSTCGSAAEAGRIAHELVEQRLAACVNVVSPVRSVYRWKGAIEESKEWLLIVKTRRELFEKLEERLRALHSYDVPEIVALPIVAGAAAYLDWIDSETAEQA